MESDDQLPSIAAINTTVFRLPMHGTLRWGQSSSLSEVRHVLVEVLLADGSSGVAEAPPRPTIYGETVQSITSVIADELAPRIVGESPDVAVKRLHEVTYNHTAKGRHRHGAARGDCPASGHLPGDADRRKPGADSGQLYSRHRRSGHGDGGG